MRADLVPHCPATALAYSELHLLISTAGFTRWTQDHDEEMRDGPAFYAEIDEAAALTAAALAQGLPPGAGDPVDAFVSAHARARRESDTPAFRTYLHGLVSRSSGCDPRLERYVGPGRHRYGRARAEHDDGPSMADRRTVDVDRRQRGLFSEGFGLRGTYDRL